MFKSVDNLGRILGLAALVCLAAPLPSLAASSIQNAQCGGSSSEFVQVGIGKGFGRTRTASQINGASNGEGGVAFYIDNSDKGSSLQGVFTSMQALVKVSRADLKNAQIGFCLGGSGMKMLPLRDYVGSPTPEGWRAVSVNTRDLNTTKQYLNKLVFVLNGGGQLVVGDTQVFRYSATTISPTLLDTNEADCSALDNCGV